MNPSAILEHLRESASLIHHPMLLPVILFRTLIDSSSQHRSKLHKDIYAIEKELGYVSFKNQRSSCGNTLLSAVSDGVNDLSAPLCQPNTIPQDSKLDIELQNWRNDEGKLRETPEYFQHMSRRLNTCKKQQASRDGRHQFWKQFRNVLEDSFKALNELVSDEKRRQLARAQLELKHWTELEGALFESLDGRDVNYNARIETQLSVVCHHSLRRLT